MIMMIDDVAYDVDDVDSHNDDVDDDSHDDVDDDSHDDDDDIILHKTSFHHLEHHPITSSLTIMLSGKPLQLRRPRRTI